MINRFDRIFNKLFISSEWNIAIRKISKELSDEENYYIPFPKDEKYWYADPMLVEEDNELYLFCEAFDKRLCIGKIAVCTLDDNRLRKCKIIISQNYHMSYPCIFKYKDMYYMIPETEENNVVEIYRASAFPFGWEKMGA